LPKRNKVLVPQVASALDKLKYEVANELGYAGHIGESAVTPYNYNRLLDNMKYEIARELGISPQIKNGYWGDIPSRECGAVGGRIGGKIGGNMVRRMIQYAEQTLQ